jgi:hypothetical protein
MNFCSAQQIRNKFMEWKEVQQMPPSPKKCETIETKLITAQDVNKFVATVSSSSSTKTYLTLIVKY